MGSVLIDRLRAGARIGGFVPDGNRWFNIGSRKEYFSLHEVVRREAWSPSYLAGELPPWPCYLHSSATVAPGAAITGSSWIGAGCLIESNVTLENSFVWPGSKVRRNTRLTGCVVAGVEVGPGEFKDEDLLP
jgi:NDP-sugar pyrophosphorylase family protein